MPQPVSPFPHGFNHPRNLLKQACRAQSKIGWDNFTKGKITRHWQNYINQYLQNKNINIPKEEWGHSQTYNSVVGTLAVGVELP
jgi:hypothetical protein